MVIFLQQLRFPYTEGWSSLIISSDSRDPIYPMLVFPDDCLFSPTVGNCVHSMLIFADEWLFSLTIGKSGWPLAIKMWREGRYILYDRCIYIGWDFCCTCSGKTCGD